MVARTLESFYPAGPYADSDSLDGERQEEGVSSGVRGGPEGRVERGDQTGLSRVLLDGARGDGEDEARDDPPGRGGDGGGARGGGGARPAGRGGRGRRARLIPRERGEGGGGVRPLPRAPRGGRPRSRDLPRAPRGCREAVPARRDRGDLAQPHRRPVQGEGHRGRGPREPRRPRGRRDRVPRGGRERGRRPRGPRVPREPERVLLRPP